MNNITITSKTTKTVALEHDNIQLNLPIISEFADKLGQALDAPLEHQHFFQLDHLNEKEREQILIVLSQAKIEVHVDLDVDVHIWPAQRVACALKWRYCVHDSMYVSKEPQLTGAQILKQAGFDPSCYSLFEIVCGTPQPRGNEELIDLRRAGIERFVTVKKTVTDGQSHTTLPARDIKELQRRALSWEMHKEGQFHWVILHNYPLPEGYQVTQAKLAVQISAGYPAAPLDMVYVQPPLRRLDAKTIPATTTTVVLQGLRFQRWSRHRDMRTSPWNPNVDGLATHLALADNWFEQEMHRGAQ